ncbi:hypothetical protein N9B43_03300 [Mariniblastus sp.]|nr:hypothetical protein [Mariniblastus sp.]
MANLKGTTWMDLSDSDSAEGDVKPQLTDTTPTNPFSNATIVDA